MICGIRVFVFFFFKQKTAYEMRISDWSLDLCSSDLTQSLSLVIDGVADVLGHSVMFIPDCIGEGAKAGVAVLAAGDVAVLENTRFHPGEEQNDPAFAD